VATLPSAAVPDLATGTGGVESVCRRCACMTGAPLDTAEAAAAVAAAASLLMVRRTTASWARSGCGAVVLEVFAATVGAFVIIGTPDAEAAGAAVGEMTGGTPATRFCDKATAFCGKAANIGGSRGSAWEREWRVRLFSVRSSRSAYLSIMAARLRGPASGRVAVSGAGDAGPACTTPDAYALLLPTPSTDGWCAGNARYVRRSSALPRVFGGTGRAPPTTPTAAVRVVVDCRTASAAPSAVGALVSATSAAAGPSQAGSSAQSRKARRAGASRRTTGESEGDTDVGRVVLPEERGWCSWRRGTLMAGSGSEYKPSLLLLPPRRPTSITIKQPLCPRRVSPTAGATLAAAGTPDVCRCDCCCCGGRSGVRGDSNVGSSGGGGGGGGVRDADAGAVISFTTSTKLSSSSPGVDTTGAASSGTAGCLFVEGAIAPDGGAPASGRTNATRRPAAAAGRELSGTASAGAVEAAMPGCVARCCAGRSWHGRTSAGWAGAGTSTKRCGAHRPRSRAGDCCGGASTDGGGAARIASERPREGRSDDNALGEGEADGEERSRRSTRSGAVTGRHWCGCCSGGKEAARRVVKYSRVGDAYALAAWAAVAVALGLGATEGACSGDPSS